MQERKKQKKSLASKTQVINPFNLGDKKNKKEQKIYKGVIHFEDNRVQSYLVFQPTFNYFQTFTSSDGFIAWKSNRKKILKFLLHLIIVLIQK